MKKIFILLLLFFSFIIKGQEKDTMEYFNIEKYKDWEIDEKWTSSENDKFLKKGNKRVRIISDSKKIQVENTSVIDPYKKVEVYLVKTKIIYGEGIDFYQFPIGIETEYDENGKVVKEIDNDKAYPFSLKELLQKIKKEYNFDLEDLTQKGSVARRIDPYLNKPIYEVLIRKSKEDIEMRKFFYILLDGITGDVLYTTSSYFSKGDDGLLSPFEEYYLALKKKQQEDNSYYKTYNGKDYTKKEWEAFEEEWYKDYKENKNKGFWDDIFPDRKKK